MHKRLRDALEDAIASGEFHPGERLDEQTLAERYRVSRTPIREALMQLSATGLVVLRPRRGAVVAMATPSQLVEMFEVMAELEGMAGRLAARRLTKADEQRLTETHECCRAAVATQDADAYYYENERFHDAIYAASHNAFLYEQCSTLHRRLKPYRRLQLRVADRLATSFREHERVFDAIISRNPAEAQLALKQHVVVQGDRFADLMASLSQLEKQPHLLNQQG